jgi:pimeloyl-ACP methyl ester carboxylesterase
VAFVISLAGLLSDGLSSVISQNYDLVEASSMKERDKQRYHQIMALMARTAYDYADSDSLQTKIYERHDIWKSADNSRFKALWGDEQDTFRFPVWFYANDASRKWYRFFIRYNPADYMKHISVPFLAINGEKDAMVNAKLNLGTAQKLMEHNPHFQTLLLPGLNHLLLPCEKGTPDEYRSIKAPLSSEVLKAVEEFILSPRIP